MSQWSHYHHITAFSEFLAYKTRVPVRGAIMLNSDMDEVVLVKGWKKGANWSFPRGKINKDEKDLDCAIREVYEETGYDVREAGLVKDEKDVKFIEITMREQHMRLYVFRDVPRDAYFEPRTRKEISKIEWYKLSELPTLKKSKQQDQGFAVANANKFYMVAPFMNPLKKWIAQQKKLDPKTHVGIKQVLQNEGEISMDEPLATHNGMTPIQAPVEMAAPSTLPEVTNSQDASVHLKRLLNINAAAVPQGPSLVKPPQTSGPDSSKSNALLELLRSGSSRGPAQQASPSYEQTSPPHVTAGADPSQHQPYPAAPLFPGFPQQDQLHGPLDKLPQLPTPSQYGSIPHLPPGTTHMNPHVPPGVIAQGFSMSPHGPPGGRQDIPPFAHRPHPAQTYPDAALPPILPMAPPEAQGHAPAPYQRTGDPQFSQQAQPTHVQGATVPHASKLPPPKLTSHSLALLNVFKDDTAKTPKTPKATLAATSQTAPVSGRKPSQHQDQLLSLLKDSPSAPAPGPVELSAHSVSPSRKRILQRPRDNTRPQEPATHAGAPVPAPSTFAPKPPGKKTQNGPNRKTNKERKSQNLASPITILPRPQSAKKEQTPTPVAVNQSSRNSSRSRPDQKIRTPEPSKPFQPQILRRSENLDNILPVRTKATPDPEQSGAGQEAKIQAGDGRRPSHNASQRDTLLSLFGKASASPALSPSGQLHLQTAVPQPSGSSSVVSPLSPLNLPTGTATNSGVPSLDINPSRIASPDNKAFLLGFLEGVAKGNK
ncbi:decapping enzyme complex catalytic subunit DCP2 [Aspergillus melleus]|uniref:decapping enzyme complex catalytic subunit DCP2 n=1 Tax=Aspergillus melleus TaxID=138277 RepID=UPI001E8D7EC1|nr:mRNA-decapping enzyme subunit 2 [Aspergillus melleus]KAH8427181.1 mRNA-decapping enzyme subunit 2 [Aspergillus melleus]